jgi:hypothetical protein
VTLAEAPENTREPESERASATTAACSGPGPSLEPRGERGEVSRAPGRARRVRRPLGSAVPEAESGTEVHHAQVPRGPTLCVYVATTHTQLTLLELLQCVPFGVRITPQCTMSTISGAISKHYSTLLSISLE